MAAKPEPHEAGNPADTPAKADFPGKAVPPADTPAEASAPPKASADRSAKAGAGFRPGAWIPALVAVIAAPLGSLVIAQFVMIPMIQEKLAQPAAAAAAPAETKGGKGAAGKNPPAYEFSNVVVNLAGTMGTRYLKTTFLVTGADDGLRGIFEENKARLTDVTLNVLSSLTMADLEEPGSKNVLREKLVTTYNEALGRKVADQIYFSDFVVQ